MFMCLRHINIFTKFFSFSGLHFTGLLFIFRVTHNRVVCNPESVGCVLNFRGCKQLSDELQASFDSKAAFLAALEA